MLRAFPLALAGIWLVLGGGVPCAGQIQPPSAGGPASSPTRPDSPALEHFESKVRPLLVEQCLNCHGKDKAKGGLRLDSAAGLKTGGDSGAVVVPGDAGQSLLIQAVRYEGEIKMPPKGKLRADQIAVLTDWVKAGAPWPATTVSSSPEPNKTGPLFTPEQKAFWAFQPLQKPAVPEAYRHLTPVDAFLRARLDAAGLKPAAAATRHALLRRVTFDLTGLPPTPEELAAFEKDQAANAFETVVNRLLESKAYGERWGRHWLDVARYADSNGLDENTAFANAWRYRDYVIQSFNDDKPYNQFLLEQIAGDLLPPVDDPRVQRERLVALGYLALGAKVLAEPDKQKMLLDIADEQLDTLGKGILGLTLGCARCHDHKFDPIPTRDYYSLLAIFTSTRTMQNLNTVAKTFERVITGQDTEQAKKDRARLEVIRRDLRKLETEFGKTPEQDKAKRLEIHTQAEVIRAEIKKLEAGLPKIEHALCVEEGSAAAYGTAPRNLYVQARGNYISPTEEAPAVFLRILAGEDQKPFVEVKPNPQDKKVPNQTRFGGVRASSGRLELARWLTDPRHPLTARVLVNRVWQHHFGEGIVRSPDNFGRLGERPTHPELLDWLAAEFVAQGWSIKKLHRWIVLSEAYRQSSGPAPAQDPENKWLSVYPRRRLEAEAIRDSMLAVAGTLDRTLGGSLFPHANFEYVGSVNYDSLRRSVYLPVIRGKTYDFFLTFDFPDPVTMNGKRVATVVAPQALFLLNNPFVARQAAAWAAALATAEVDPAARIQRAYRQAFLREATAAEVARAQSFLARYDTILQAQEKDAARRGAAAWAAWCQMIFASNEFVFLD